MVAKTGDLDEVLIIDTVTSSAAVVLNKPIGYVSGQAEHGNPPAIRLLTPDSLWADDEANIPVQLPTSWDGFAPAGRLDMDSTGLLVFSKSGVLTKKIISSNSTVEKEYVVHVSPAEQPTRQELRLNPSFHLPATTLDLSPLLERGNLLLGDEKKRNPRLKPCVDVQWIKPGEILRISLNEGRKRHIRSACRELLGWHVTALQRIRVGPIHLENLPEGCWRPLRQREIEQLLSS
jgi:23S rRNA pseudouridine2604 synthase